MAVQARKAGARGLLLPEANAAEAAVVQDLPVYGSEQPGAGRAFPDRRNPAGARGRRHRLPLGRAPGISDRLQRGQGPGACQNAPWKSQRPAATTCSSSARPVQARPCWPSAFPRCCRPWPLRKPWKSPKSIPWPENCRAAAPLMVERPFRSPHHTISDVGLVGGGHYPRPGEVSMAHRGVLFLDELPEFKKHALEVLRQPLEDGRVSISRSLVTLTYPADFMLVAAMNPCPCGYLGDDRHECSCSRKAIELYRSRLSGPPPGPHRPAGGSARRTLEGPQTGAGQRGLGIHAGTGLGGTQPAAGALRGHARGPAHPDQRPTFGRGPGSALPPGRVRTKFPGDRP